MKSPGLLGYYREYVKDFSKIAKLSFDLLKVDSHKDIKSLQKTIQIQWNNEHHPCLQKLLTILTSPLTLQYLDFSSPFILHVIASDQGLGCPLFQKLDNQMKILGFRSRTFRQNRNITAVN